MKTARNVLQEFTVFNIGGIRYAVSNSVSEEPPYVSWAMREDMLDMFKNGLGSLTVVKEPRPFCSKGDF